MKATYSGLAGDASDVLANPSHLIAHPLYIPKDDGEPLPYSNAEFIANPSLHPEPEAFEVLLRRRAAFVPAGTAFVLEMGLVAKWFQDDDIREPTKAAIDARGWKPVLSRLEYKETDGDLFAKKLIGAYANTMPPVRREGPIPKTKALSDLEIWRQHRLRLRKAIEYVALVEHIVRHEWRRIAEPFRLFTGRKDADENLAAAYVLEHFWIEPVIYVPDPRPRPGADIREIMASPELVGWFKQATGQPEGALYWSLRGAPSKYKTTEAVCQVLDRFYGRGPTRVATIEMKDYDVKARIVGPGAGVSDAGRTFEYMPELGPAILTASELPRR